MHIENILDQINGLNPVAGEGWDSGPYSEQQLSDIENRLGRMLDPDHRAALKAVGGSFCFDLGPVLVGDTGRDVSVFLGAGEDDHNIVDEWEGYSGQIPADWYPFARDSDGNLYCITDRGFVHHLRLDEDEWSTRPRPPTGGDIVSESWLSFVMSLRLPDWAHDG